MTLKVDIKIYKSHMWTTIHITNSVIRYFSITHENRYSFNHELSDSDDVYKQYPITYNLRKAFKRYFEFETCWRKYLNED